jgi:3-deoxy-manno-octulosonate cytidylyltransferase (CMP-KDO synthetase)
MKDSKMNDDTLIIIPARLASTRLSRKMLQDIGGKPLIIRTLEHVVSAGVGDVVVACDGDEIAEVVRQAGGKAIITDPDLPSGTDRVFAAFVKYNKIYKEKDKKFVINVQGDLPFITSDFIEETARILRNTNYDISTVAAPIKDDSYLLSNVVKPVIAFTSENSGKALYFSRAAIPSGGPFFHHVGIYGFRSETLQKFVDLPQSLLEKSEKLEQLRALENHMTIGISVIDTEIPISIDTPEDLEVARSFIAL